MSENMATYNTMDKKIKTPEPYDPFLTVKDVANIIKAPASSVNKLFNSPGFPGRKVKHIGWRVRKSKLYEYFDNLNHYGNE